MCENEDKDIPKIPFSGVLNEKVTPVVNSLRIIPKTVKKKGKTFWQKAGKFISNVFSGSNTVGRVFTVVRNIVLPILPKGRFFNLAINLISKIFINKKAGAVAATSLTAYLLAVNPNQTPITMEHINLLYLIFIVLGAIFGWGAKHFKSKSDEKDQKNVLSELFLSLRSVSDDFQKAVGEDSPGGRKVTTEEQEKIVSDAVNRLDSLVVRFGQKIINAIF